MLNKKRKGFTIVELVIVIAVIAVLATVLIPTFAGIIDKANESADKQAVRQMNIALAAEAIENEPADVGDVIKILAAAGFNSIDKLVPVSAGHGFYWCKAANMITLIRDEGENSPQLIFPTEEAAVNTAFDAAKTNWTAATTGDDAAFVDLEPAGEDANLPTGGGTGDDNGGGAGVLTIDNLPTAFAQGGEFKLPEGGLTISSALEVAEDAELTIDLNGQELELIVNDSNVFSVLGELTIKDTKDENSEAGKIVINNNTTDFREDNYYLPGICVGDSTAAEPVGKLTLSNVEIEGSAPYPIINYGTVSLETGTEVIVNGETGLYNEGIAAIQGATFTVNSGIGFANYYAGTVEDVKISGNTSFLLNGANVIAIKNDGGKMSVTKTEISKLTGFTCDEYYCGTIYVIDNAYSNKSEISLEDVTVAEDMGTSVNVDLFCKATIDGGTYNSVNCSAGSLTIKAGTTVNNVVSCSGSDSSLIIEGGIFNGVISCRNACSVTINGGQFNGGLSCNENEAIIKITNGTFDGALNIAENSKIDITGGTFNKNVTFANSNDTTISGGVFKETIIINNNVKISGGTFVKQLQVESQKVYIYACAEDQQQSYTFNDINYANFTETSDIFTGDVKLKSGTDSENKSCWIIG